MKATEHWLSVDVSGLDRLDWPRYRTVVLQSQMSSAPVVVVQILPENSTQMPLVHDDHVIQAFPPNRPDHFLYIWVLPWRPLGCPDLLDAQRGDPTSEA